MNTPLDRIKQANELKQRTTLENKRQEETIDAIMNTQETILRSFKALVDYLDRKVTKTEVVNQFKSIRTPDALEVAKSVESLHETIKTHENTDLTETVKALNAILDEAKKLPKEIPTVDIPKPLDFSDQLKDISQAMSDVEQAIKSQETTIEAPVVNIDAPVVKVEAPDLKPLQKASNELLKAVKAIVIPEVKPTDITPLLKEQKKTNKILEELPMGGGGGGSIPTTYQTSEGDPTQVQTTPQGEVPIATASLDLQVDDTGTYTYLGSASPGTATSESLWRIKRVTNASGVITHADGTSLFNKEWDERIGYTY